MGPQPAGVPARRLFLVGMMGAGKSSVARSLVARTGWPSVDTDKLVEQAAGMTVPDLFREAGEDAFRAAESRAVAEAAAMPEPVVVSVGGGAVLRPENRDVMRVAGTVVWLRARPSTLAVRVGRGEGRPLLAAVGPDSSLEAVLAGISASRDSLYQEAAMLVIDVDGLSAAQTADAVLAQLRARQVGSAPS
ncbi:MAG TPA: shikimate kinase [Acidimicrobiales bacterium]|nr:shikimate kinase [Acidimicrobiales bacterium]